MKDRAAYMREYRLRMKWERIGLEMEIKRLNAEITRAQDRRKLDTTLVFQRTDHVVELVGMTWPKPDFVPAKLERIACG